jgi:hypothetical protein
MCKDDVRVLDVIIVKHKPLLRLHDRKNASKIEMQFLNVLLTESLTHEDWSFER